MCKTNKKRRPNINKVDKKRLKEVANYVNANKDKEFIINISFSDMAKGDTNDARR